jgi:hypothetical protein
MNIIVKPANVTSLEPRLITLASNVNVLMITDDVCYDYYLYVDKFTLERFQLTSIDNKLLHIYTEL